jgi:hypothetical protein
LGWFDWRFHIKQQLFLDAALRECDEASAQFIKVTLVKVATTLSEKMIARTMQPGFGGLPDDLEPADPIETAQVRTGEQEPAATATAQLVELE